MLTAKVNASTVSDWRLPNYTRSILAENKKALMRRWQIARSTEDLDPRVLARWFPEQDHLLELLAVLSEEEMLRIANTQAPLFTMVLHEGLKPATVAALVQPGELEAANRQEAFMALAIRLDALRTSSEQGCVIFDLSASEGSYLGRMAPHDLWDLAANPALVLVPAASDRFFDVAATRDMTSGERTMYMGMSKRSRTGLL